MNATRKCSVKGCENKHYGRGYCDMHYRRVRRTGSAGPANKLHVASWAGASCSVDGCDGKVKAKGLCSKHVKRWYRRGTTERLKQQPLADYMAERTVPGEPPEDRPGLGPCHLWTVRITPHGYGLIGLSGRYYNTPAHRIAYMLSKGPIPDGEVIDHLCRVRNCVNPEHLEAVTNEENLRRGAGYRLRNGMDDKCRYGHPYTDENSYRDKKGCVRCRACARANNRKRSPRNRKQI